MKNFTCVQDIGNLKTALDEAFEIKKDRFKYVELGRNKTLMMIFFNSSLRTRLSTQKAALNLGMNVIVLDINQGAWKLETERGVIMDGDKPEHLLEAIPVMGCYCDVIGVRSFARFEDREYDYNEVIPVSYTHLRAHETGRNLVCRLLLEKKKYQSRKGTRSNYFGSLQ